MLDVKFLKISVVIQFFNQTWIFFSFKAENVHVKITGRGIRLFTDFTHEHPEYPGHRFTLSEKVYLLWGCVKPDFYETDMGTYVGHYCSPQLRSKDGRTTNTAYTNFEMHYVNSVYSYAAGSHRKALVELGMRIGVAKFLASDWGYRGVCYASPVAWLASSVFLFFAYRYFIRMFERIYKVS